MSDCEQCKSFYLELERLRRLTPNGTYTLNVAHEEELERMREALRAAEKRELEALVELAKARAALQRVVEYDRDPTASWSDLMSWCRGALMDKEEREARCKYLVRP